VAKKGEEKNVKYQKGVMGGEEWRTSAKGSLADSLTANYVPILLTIDCDYGGNTAFPYSSHGYHRRLEGASSRNQSK